MSIDLDKAVYFCHGGCDEPRGGGPIEFITRWAKVKEQRDISREEARGELIRAFKTKDAKTAAREMELDNVALFADDAVRTGLFVVCARYFERMVEHVNALCIGLPTREEHDWVWTALDDFHTQIRFYDDAHAVCVAACAHGVTPEAVSLYKDATQKRLWHPLEAAERASWRTQEEQCRPADDAPTPKIPRTPVSLSDLPPTSPFDSRTRPPRTPVRLSEMD